MPKHFVYILQSQDGRFYTGYTTDIKRRMAEHKSGKGAKFTKAFGFKKLMYTSTHRTRSKAMQREAEIKKMNRYEKEELIVKK